MERGRFRRARFQFILGKVKPSFSDVIPEKDGSKIVINDQSVAFYRPM